MTRSMADVDELCDVFKEKLVLVNIAKHEINSHEFEIQKGRDIKAKTFINTYFWKEKSMAVILKAEPNWGVEDRATFDREYQILSSLKHRNIVQIFGFTTITSLKRFALVIELADGSLNDYLDQNTTLITKFGWLTDIASAVDYLHNGAIVKTLHRDLKPHNVLVFMKNKDLNSSSLKLTDFGLSTIETSQYMSNRAVGTPGWVANEIYNLQPATEKSDVFGFGMTAMAIFFGKGLEVTLNSLIKQRGNTSLATVDFSNIDVSACDVKNVSEITPFLELFKNCVRMVPEDRPTMKDCKLRLEIIIQYGIDIETKLKKIGSYMSTSDDFTEVSKLPTSARTSPINVLNGAPETKINNKSLEMSHKSSMSIGSFGSQIPIVDQESIILLNKTVTTTFEQKITDITGKYDVDYPTLKIDKLKAGTSNENGKTFRVDKVRFLYSYSIPKSNKIKNAKGGWFNTDNDAENNVFENICKAYKKYGFE